MATAIVAAQDQGAAVEAVTAMELPRTGDAGPVWEPAALKIAGADAAQAGTMSWTVAGVPKGQSTAPGAEENTGVGKTSAVTVGTLTSIEVNSHGQIQTLVSGCSR